MQVLLHSGYHLVHHHEASLPHLGHGIGTLVCILVVVHILAIAYLCFLFSKPLPPNRRRKRGADLRHVRCEDDFMRTPGRAVVGRSNV
jgi:hypothetical protein